MAVTQNNSVKVSIRSAPGSFVVADIRKTTTQNDSSKANIRVTTTQNQSSKACIVVTNSKGNSSKVNIVVTNTKNISAKANIVVSNSFSFSSKASINRIVTVSQSAKTNLFFDTFNAAKVSIVRTNSGHSVYTKVKIKGVVPIYRSYTHKGFMPYTSARSPYTDRS